MSITGWFTRKVERFRLRAAIAVAPRSKLHCADCGAAIRKRERYEILLARHRNCHDPKLVGQMSIPGATVHQQSQWKGDLPG
jgi:hypothetical protein